MPWFFFHLHECGSDTLDATGRDLPDLATAIDIGIVAAREVMAHEVMAGKLCLSCYIDIADQQGTTLAHVMFRDVLSLTGL